MLMSRPLLSAAGQVDEDAGKGVKPENKLANCQVSLAFREDTQRGWEGGGHYTDHFARLRGRLGGISPEH